MNVSPGTAFEATVSGFASGLVGTIGVEIVDNLGGVTTGRTTTNMVELVASSGSYAKAFTAGECPATQGQYTIVWDDGSGNYAIDDLLVSYSAYTPSSPSGRDLTSLAQAKNWLAITDTSQDTRLQQLITAASHAVMEYAQREFAPSSSAGVTRQFALKRDGLVTFGKYDLQTASAVQIDTESGGSPTTLTTDQYQLLPIDEPHGVYRMLRFYTFAIGPVLRQAFGLYRQVGVTGTWGFPSVPSDVEQATLVTVAKWFKRDEVAWSNEMPAPSLSDGLNLPFDARMLLQPYKRGA